MEKRYQVFVSSTFDDLREERQIVMQALLELDCIPSGMELFPSADDEQWTYIRKTIDDCDYYVLILAGRYGSEGPDGRSFTQMEYEYALANNKPTIAFLHKDPDKLPADQTERHESARKKLEAFRSLARRKLCRFWSSPDELGAIVSRSITQLKKSRPAIGWVRADLIGDETSSQEIARLRRKIEDLENKLSAVSATSADDLRDFIEWEEYLWVEVTGTRVGQCREVKVRWRDALRAVLSRILVSSPEQDMKLGLEHFVQRDLPELGYEHTNVNSADFDLIKVRLCALRLAEVEPHTDEFGFNHAYWRITARGLESLSLLSGETLYAEEDQPNQ